MIRHDICSNKHFLNKIYDRSLMYGTHHNIMMKIWCFALFLCLFVIMDHVWKWCFLLSEFRSCGCHWTQVFNLLNDGSSHISILLNETIFIFFNFPTFWKLRLPPYFIIYRFGIFSVREKCLFFRGWRRLLRSINHFNVVVFLSFLDSSVIHIFVSVRFIYSSMHSI